MDKEQLRIAWIDVMKGFLFTLVVLGHFLTTLPTPEFLIEIYDFFSPFRMPAYFFLSGLLFSTRRLKTYILYIKSKSRTLLLPYISLTIVFLLLDWNIYSDFDYLLFGLKRIFISGVSAYKSQPLWFVFTLYVVCLLYYPFHQFGNRYPWFFPFLAGIFILTSYIISRNNICLPFNLGTAISAMPFFICGVASKKIVFIITTYPFYKKSFFMSIFFIGYIIIYFTNNIGGRLFDNQIENYFVFYFLSLLGIIWFSCLCSEFVKLKCKVIGILENIARNALIILGTHGYILIIETFVFNNMVKEINNYIIFVSAFITLIISEILCIVYANKYFYFFLGKKQLSIKESLSIRKE